MSCLVGLHDREIQGAGLRGSSCLQLLWRHETFRNVAPRD